MADLLAKINICHLILGRIEKRAQSAIVLSHSLCNVLLFTSRVSLYLSKHEAGHSNVTGSVAGDTSSPLHLSRKTP